MDERLKKMKRQAEIRTAITVLAQEHTDIENELSRIGDAPEWARKAAERAFTEADRWHQGIAPFDIEKLARIIENEYLLSIEVRREGECMSDKLKTNEEGGKNNFLLQTMDAEIWTDEWLRIVKENPSIPTDKGSMLGWFANAIMAGFDEASRRGQKENKC